MKKILFGLIGLIGLGLINFSSAVEYVFTGDLNTYQYVNNSITLTEEHTFTVFDFQSLSLGEDSYCTLAFDHSQYDSTTPDCSFGFEDGSLYRDEKDSGSCTFPAGTVYVGRSDGSVCSSVVLSFGDSLLIDPSECPVCENTFSTLFVDGTQITGSSNIYISTPDYFEYNPTYYTGYMDLVIENVGDTEYIENILAVQTYSPTSDEFALSFVGGLTLILPYILITLFVIFIWKIIKKIFK